MARHSEHRTAHVIGRCSIRTGAATSCAQNGHGSVRGTACLRDNGADRLLKRASVRDVDSLVPLGLRNVHVGSARNTEATKNFQGLRWRRDCE